jgi:hypothetical protein
MCSWLTGEATAIARALGVDAIICYVDDIAVCGATAADCQAALDIVLAVCAYLGLAVNPDKVKLPTQRIELLGLEIDARPGFGRVGPTPLRLFMLLCDLAWLQAVAASGDDRVHVDFLASLAGRLSFVAATTFAGRVHTAAFHHAAGRAGGGLVRVRSIPSFMGEVAWWVRYIEGGAVQGHAMVRVSGDALRVAVSFAPDAVAAPPLQLQSDAAGDVGFGATFGSRALWGTWTRQQLVASVQVKELEPVVRAFEAWGADWAGRFVLIASDNIGNVFAINSGVTRGAGQRSARRIIRRLYALAQLHGFEFAAVWLPRELNVTCDDLSKSPSFSAAAAVASAAGCSLTQADRR